MKLYIHELSGHSHRARLMASLLQLTPEIIPVDLLSGDHKSKAFLAKNPFGQVPVLEDCGITISDSNAIIHYLASRYDKDRSYIPKDHSEASEVQFWLSKASNELASSVAAARLVTVFQANYDQEALIEKAHQFLEIMEQHLIERNWFVAGKPTIADVALYSYTSRAPEGGVSLDNYKNIKSWLSRVEALEGFIPMPQAIV
ncbi:MAG: glutathione S-transferase [Pseudobacteriovorax sp.]|nr:glutathione S-transferase [Pseudobacteriovorax sp.]